MVLPGSKRPLLLPPDDVLDIVVVCPESNPAIRDQALVFNKKQLVYFKLPEVIAMDDIVVKVKQTGRPR